MLVAFIPLTRKSSLCSTVVVLQQHADARALCAGTDAKLDGDLRGTSLDAQGCVETGSTYSGMRAQVAQGVAYQRRYARSNDPVIPPRWLVVA